MIQRLADILRAFMFEEAKKLNAFDLRHGPTIGAMYEGLSKKILGKAVPSGLDLQVTAGFVVDLDGSMSDQIDCMLVRGAGEQVPYTELHKWPVWNVLAVFEVKKTLSSRELKDSFIHLRGIYNTFSTWFLGDHSVQRINIEPAFSAFSEITGIHAPGTKSWRTLPPDLQAIYYTLVVELLAPLRIVLGYGGYRTEQGLRQGLLDFLEEQRTGPGLGIPSFPHLITSGGFSLVKGTGQPYLAPIQDHQWDFLFSSPTNPAWIMLELLWAKIANVCEINLPWGDDSTQEVFHKFIAAEPFADAAQGWTLHWTPFNAGGR